MLKKTEAFVGCVILSMRPPSNAARSSLTKGCVENPSRLMVVTYSFVNLIRSIALMKGVVNGVHLAWAHDEKRAFRIGRHTLQKRARIPITEYGHREEDDAEGKSYPKKKFYS